MPRANMPTLIAAAMLLLACFAGPGAAQQCLGPGHPQAQVSGNNYRRTDLSVSNIQNFFGTPWNGRGYRHWTCGVQALPCMGVFRTDTVFISYAHNQIHSIYRTNFVGMSRLTALDLCYNRIKEIRSDTFITMYGTANSCCSSR